MFIQRFQTVTTNPSNAERIKVMPVMQGNEIIKDKVHYHSTCWMTKVENFLRDLQKTTIEKPH